MSDGGPLGGGGFFGQAGPQGPYGAWPSCGCGSLVIVLGGLIVACGGLLSFFRM